MNWKKWTGIVVVLAVLLFIGYSVYSSSQGEEVPTVRTAEATEDAVTEIIVANGTIIPSESQEVIGQGIVSELNVVVGDTVEEGDPLLTYIDGTSYSASFSGTVTQVNVNESEPDNNAQQGQPSVAVSDLNELEVEVQLSRSDAARVEADQPVTLTYGENEFAGTVAQIDPVATQQPAQTGTSAALGALITFDENPEELIAGFAIDADITVAEEDQALIIPIEALNYDDDNQPYVYTVTNDAAARTEIETGIQSNTTIEVTSGLSAGDQVILSPSAEISNETQVEIEE